MNHTHSICVSYGAFDVAVDAAAASATVVGAVSAAAVVVVSFYIFIANTYHVRRGVGV